jgi:L-gulono-1,4-lactone dehydrogenase
VPAEWRNWTGDQLARPVRDLAPADAGEVADAVRAATRDGLRVRMVGSGHSFPGAALTDGVLLRPDRLTGLVAVDRAARTATVRAGTRLADVSRLLAEHDLALENLGDIDEQTVAGAIATGTHGTGAAYGGLAAQVLALELVLAGGTLASCDATTRPDLLAAATVGLGAYGIVTAVTLRCVPAFALHAVEEPARLDDVLERWDSLPAEADHLDIYWWPHTSDCQIKRNTRVSLSELDPLPRWQALLDDELVANGLFGVVCRAGVRLPALVPPTNRLATRLLRRRSYTDVSHRVFASRRRVRFHETEWALPRAAVPDVLRELDATIRRRGWRISFPVEVRVSAADDRWLSPAYGRETGYVAAHRYLREPYAELVDAMTRIAGAAGRPHWGKLHPLDAVALAPRYPRFADALALRAEVDPEGRFANAYTDRVLGPLVGHPR